MLTFKMCNGLAGSMKESRVGFYNPVVRRSLEYDKMGPLSDFLCTGYRTVKLVNCNQLLRSVASQRLFNVGLDGWCGNFTAIQNLCGQTGHRSNSPLSVAVPVQ